MSLPPTHSPCSTRCTLCITLVRSLYVPLSLYCTYSIPHYGHPVNRQCAQMCRTFFVQGLLVWQLGPRRTCTAQRVYCIITHCYYCIVHDVLHALLCVYMCMHDKLLCCVGVLALSLCVFCEAQTIDFVFFSRCKKNKKVIMMGGVFREKIFLKTTNCFSLGKIVLKFIFDFGLRVKK